MPKSPKKKTQGTAATAKSKTAEEMDGGDGGDSEPSFFISGDAALTKPLTDHEESCPEDFKMIHKISTGPSAI